MRKKQLLRTGISVLIASAMMITSIPATGNAAVSDGVTSAKGTVMADDNRESREAGYYLTVYSTEKNFYASAANLEQETKSVYFAVSRDGKNFEVLNNGGGVIYAKTGSKCVVAPQVYKTTEGFKVIAQDGVAANGYHIFTSGDGVAYYSDTLDKNGDSDYDSVDVLDKAKCTLMFKGENILETDSTITLGNALSLTETEYKRIVDKLGTVVNTGVESLAAVNAGTDVEGVLQQKYPSVNATYSDGSTQAFNVDWSGAAAGVNLSQMGNYTVKGKLQQTKYLNNLKAINGSTLPEDDPERAEPNFPDNYDPETGQVYFDKTKYIEGMADPNIYWDEQTGYYYMTGSYFPEESDASRLENDNPVLYDRVVLRRGRTLEELQDRSKQVTIWKVGNQQYTNNSGGKAKGYRYIWAPELHRVGDKWVVYFTESHSGDTFNIYCHALILDGTQDPYDTALNRGAAPSEWEDYQMRGGTGGITKAITSNFCLDMTYFEDGVNGEPYVIWASKAEGNSKLYIAQVSKEEPWVITSEIVRLSQPEYGWENVRYVVDEGPTVLQKNGKVFMCFSASGTGSEYAIGMMTANQGDNLLDLSKWTKNPYPLLSSRDVNGEEGPGHNSFTVDKDGNAIFVYHARPTSHNYKHCGWNGTESLHYNDEPLEDPCRHARLKRVHWASDGTPILKMTYENELTEENQEVSVQVVVPGIKLDKNTLSLQAGKSGVLRAEVFSAAGANVSWTSSNNNIASVSNGTVTAKKAGTATITARQADGKTATCTVTVTGSLVNKVTIDKKTLTMGGGEKITLNATVDPKGEKVTWSSSNPKAAIVSSTSGLVTAKKVKKAATTKITAKVGDKTSTCTITVKPAPDKKVKVTLNKKKVTMKTKGKNKTFQIKPKVNSKYGSATFKYTIDKKGKKVVKVDKNGKVTAKKKGKATITVKTFNNKGKATLKITVK